MLELSNESILSIARKVRPNCRLKLKRPRFFGEKHCGLTMAKIEVYVTPKNGREYRTFGHSVCVKCGHVANEPVNIG